MRWPDWLILVAYLGSLAAIGASFARRQETAGEFFRGSGQVGWLAVGVSLMAALNSGMDYIQTPAIVFALGMVYVAMVLTWIPLYPWVTLVTIPFYRRLNITSAYEYLERRFGYGVRAMAAAVFVLWRIGWMAVALYVPCLAVKGATGDAIDITWMVLVLGAVVTLYTMLGGIKAVIWTDVLQFCVMFGGLFATLAYVIGSVPGGLTEVISTARDAGRLSLAAQIPGFDGAGFAEKFFRYFTTEVTFVGIVACILVGRLAAYTSDQVAVQRFQAIGTFRNARRALVVSAVADVVWMVVLGFVGLALFAYFRHHPFPAGLQNDRILPYFMASNFPTGLTGLVCASIFAASLSSVDAALNSATSVIVTDFYEPLVAGRAGGVANGRSEVTVSRAVNCALGVIVTAIAANVERMGEIYTIANKVLGAFFGILFGMFVLGMFSRRTRGGVVVAASLAGLAASCFLSFFSEFNWLHDVCRTELGEGFVAFCSRISWQWPPLVGVAVTVLVAGTVGAMWPAEDIATPPLTYWEVMRLPDPVDVPSGGVTQPTSGHVSPALGASSSS